MNSYCLKCKNHTQSIDPEIVKIGNRYYNQSICANCGSRKSQGTKAPEILKKKKTGKGLGYDNGVRADDGKTRYGMGCMDCGNTCGKKPKVKYGGNFTPARDLYNRSYGSSLLPGDNEEFQVDRVWYENQDLNEYQDELTAMRINYMKNIYEMNVSRDNEGDAIENETLPDGVDEYGNIIKNEEILVNEGEQAKPISQYAGEDVELEEGGDLYSNQKRDRSFYVRPIEPVTRQTQLDTNFSDRAMNGTQYENEKYQQVMKRYGNLEYVDITPSLKTKIHEQGGYIPESEIVDPWVIWRERNGYMQEDHTAYIDDIIRRRQQIYRDQTNDINQFEFPEYQTVPRWSLTLENDVSRAQGKARSGRNNKLEIVSDIIKEEQGVMPYDYLTDNEYDILQQNIEEESRYDDIDPNTFPGDDMEDYQDTTNTQLEGDVDNTPFSYDELDAWFENEDFSVETFNKFYHDTPLDELSQLDRKRLEELRYVETFNKDIFNELLNKYGLVDMNTKGGRMRKRKILQPKMKKTKGRK